MAATQMVSDGRWGGNQEQIAGDKHRVIKKKTRDKKKQTPGGQTCRGNIFKE